MIPPWTFIDCKTMESFCQRCKERERLPLPMPIKALDKWAKYFGAKHEGCKEKEPK